MSDIFVSMVTVLHKKFTLGTIADELGISERQVWNILHRSAIPSGVTAMKLVEFYEKYAEKPEIMKCASGLPSQIA